MQPNWQELLQRRDPVADLLYAIEAWSAAYLEPSPHGVGAECFESPEGDERIARYDRLERILGLTLDIRDADPGAAEFYRHHAIHFARLVFCLATAQRVSMGWPVSFGLARAATLLEAELRFFRQQAPGSGAGLFAAAATRLPVLAVRMQHAWQRRRARASS